MGRAPLDGVFDEIAGEIVRTLKPQTVLDVGCGLGFLIDALWKRGVRAYGVDISEYAISEVPQDLKPFCFFGQSIEEKFGHVSC